MDLDSRSTALILARGRAILGLVMLVLPGLPARLMFGESSPRIRALLRMVGVRDLILGVGALTTVKERTQDAEWVGVGAFADAVDGVVSLTSAAPSIRAPASSVRGLSPPRSSVSSSPATSPTPAPPRPPPSNPYAASVAVTSSSNSSGRLVTFSHVASTIRYP